ncbi:hypothetical protein Taro_021057 [Colocasia esculenta]|uniref:Uncharacterized protein n=1 Tax=Colocasia esculenta TaxID=4460 RepID=A0A843V0D0_COLES|nr:hypothetical protein [Colocasia esculenta]
MGVGGSLWGLLWAASICCRKRGEEGLSSEEEGKRVGERLTLPLVLSAVFVLPPRPPPPPPPPGAVTNFYDWKAWLRRMQATLQLLHGSPSSSGSYCRGFTGV